MKYTYCKQVYSITSKELVEKEDYYSEIAALMIRLAKLDDTNKECLGNIIHF